MHKFRAWNDTKKEWINEGDVWMTNYGGFFAGDMNNPPVITIHRDNINFSTGLHDKNGKEVYEGDYIQSKDEDGNLIIDKVVFEKGAFRGKPVDGNLLEEMLEDYEWMEVIGNVHEMGAE